MSSYPKWWDTTLTVYNRYEDPVTNIILWYKTIIPNCFWKYAGNKMKIGDEILETNNVICRIPKQSTYLPRFEWEQLPNDEKASHFTLSVNDIIIQGSADDVIDEYKAGQRSSDLLAKYKRLQGCMTIERVADNSGNYRNDKHYYVTGI